MRKALLSILISAMIARLVLLPTLAEGFDLRAHTAISDRAIQESGLDSYLKDQLGLRAGIATVLSQFSSTRRVDDWIRVGSRLEDSSIRPLHHFHNPTRTWDEAGLRVTGIRIGQSAVRWGQERLQAPGGQHSWHDARASFLRALTAETDAARQSAYAETFQSLGHLLHLVQDMAVPAHTRNDSHLVLFGIHIDPDGFEAWAEGEASLTVIQSRESTPSRRFDPSVLTLPPNPLAPVPIARILDTERYRQTGVPEAGTNIGLAEYSSANFFSEGTIFSSQLPFPRESSVDLNPTVETNTRGQPRRYLVKIRDGEVGRYRLAVPSALYGTLQAALADQWQELDERVFEDYARLLFPRAVGYSAALLDYFFRGGLEVEVAAHATDPTQRELRATNRSAEPLGPGRLTLYAENAEGRREAVPGAVLQMTEPVQPEAPLPVLPFTPPAGVTGYVVVFEGQLGQEAAAVVGAVERAKLEAVFVGSKSGIGTAVFVATENGTFLLRRRESGEFLDRASWGMNGNIVLIQGRFLPDTSKTSWQVWRINRGPNSAQMPLLEGQAVDGVEKIDATLVETHPVRPDLVVPGTLSANATTHVLRTFNAHQTELFTLGGGTDMTVDYEPLTEDTVSFAFSASSAINLDASKLPNIAVMRSDPVIGYVDARNHLIVLYALAWTPGALFSVPQFQNVQFWAARHPVHEEGVFNGQFTAVVHQTAYLSTPPSRELNPTIFKVGPGAPPSVQDLVVVDLTEGKVLAKSFTDVSYSWTRRLYGRGEAGFILTHRHAFPAPAGLVDQVFPGPGLQGGLSGPLLGVQVDGAGNRILVAAGAALGRDITDVTVTGRGFFGLHVNPPVTQQVTVFDDPDDFFAGTVNLYALDTDPGEHHVEQGQSPIEVWRPQVQRQGFVFVATRNRQLGADNVYQIIRWQFPIEAGEPESLGMLLERATPAGDERMFVELEAHDKAVYATFRDFDFGNLLEAVLVTDAERSVPTIPGRIEFAFPAEQVNNKPGDRRLYSIVEDNGTASFAQRNKPANDILGADNLGGVNPVALFEDGVFVPRAMFHLVGQ